MSTSPIYTYPVPKLAAGTPIIEATQGTITINNVYDKYVELFGDSGVGGNYGKYLEEALVRLKKILNSGYGISDGKIDTNNLETTFTNLKSDGFYTEAQRFDIERNGGTIIEKHWIDENCREGFLAYRYYLKTIISILDRIHNYLVGGREALKELKDEIDSDAAHPLITQLEINEKLMYEEFQKLSTYYKYNQDTKQWDQVVLFNKAALDTPHKADYSDEDEEKNDTKNFFNSQSWRVHMSGGFSTFRALTVKCTDSGTSGTKVQDIPFSVFNSVTLLDRLWYIRRYYFWIFYNGTKDTDYSVFPNDVDTGYPCLPNKEKTKSTEDTKSLGALELFYVGYLIDRDGPINAVASFFEVKVAALRNNLELMSKKITALNAYLENINYGMDKLNESQTNKKKDVGEKPVIPEDTVCIFTYLCCQKMYNLFEAGNMKHFVISSIYDGDSAKNHYIVPVEKEKGFGKRVDVYDKYNNTSKDYTYPLRVLHGHHFSEGGGTDTHETIPYINLTDLKTESISSTAGTFTVRMEKKDWDSNPFKCSVGHTEKSCGQHTQKTEHFAENGCALGGDGVGFRTFTEKFTVPTELEVQSILPESVKYYKNAMNKSVIDSLSTDDYNAMIESWTNAFSNKTQYINTAIDTINTDVSVDRSKIDTFDSLTSTFRSRAQDTYLNIVSNIRS